MKSLLVVLALLLVSCSTQFHYFPETIYIDPAFTVEEQEQIILAIDDWNKATKGYVEEYPVIGYRPTNVRSDHRILKTTSRNPYVRKHHSRPKNYGFCRTSTFWGTKRAGAIWLVTDRIKDLRTLRIVAVHELGHHYGLKHEASHTYSIMASPFDHSDEISITCIDVQQFEMLYGIKIGC